MLPGSAQTVRDLSGAPMAAKLAARQQTSDTPRSTPPTVLLFIADLRKRVFTKPPAVLEWTRACEEGFNWGRSLAPRASPKEKPGGFRHRACLAYTPALRPAAHAEGVQSAALRNRREIGSLGHRRRADGAEFVVEIQARGHGQTDPTAYARPHGDVLLALHGI